MSEKRTLLSRPRTRVYDCNYNAGEKYYKPMVEQLDRKYSSPTSFPPGTFTTPSFSTPSFSGRIRDDDDFAAPRRSPFASDLEAPLERHSGRRLTGDSRSLEEDLEDEIASSMRKLKMLRSAKAASIEEELTPHNGIFNGLPKHKRLNLTDKILDSVGVNGKLQDSLEEEILKKRTVKMPSLFDEEPASGFTKWTAAARSSFGDESAELAAKARARKSRARLADIENEMEAVAQKGIAREQRLSNLKSLIAGEDPFVEAVGSDSFTSKRVNKSVKKVTF